MTNLAAALIVYLDETDAVSLSIDGERAKAVLISYRRITKGPAKQSQMGPEQQRIYQAALKTLRKGNGA